jgi:peptidyl-dipeptidase Dcp
MTLFGIATTAAEAVTLTETKSTITNAAIESDNPLLRSWSDQPFNLPPFKDIRTEHFVPAFDVAMAAHIADLEAIASSSLNDFDSILGAYDRAGSLLSKVASVYSNYTSSLNTPDMQLVQTTMAPILSRHNSKAYDIPGLFRKIESVYKIRNEKLKSGEWTAEQARFVERVHKKFLRMGAKFDAVTKGEYADIQGETLAGFLFVAWLSRCF